MKESEVLSAECIEPIHCSCLFVSDVSASLVESNGVYFLLHKHEQVLTWKTGLGHDVLRSFTPNVVIFMSVSQQ